MIVTALLTLLWTIIKGILSLIPSLPPLPESVQDILNFFVNFVAGSFGFIMHIYTPVLAGALVAMTIAILFFDQGYYVVVWVLKRLRLWK